MGWCVAEWKRLSDTGFYGSQTELARAVGAAVCQAFKRLHK